MIIDYPQDQVTEASKFLLEQGIKILQGNRLGDTDERHVAALMSYMDLPYGARVLDVGSGFGEVTRIMSLIRPDLRFWLLNSNTFQAENCVHDGAQVSVGDMHRLPYADASFDVVMFCFSFCHTFGYRSTPAADEGKCIAMTEAFRVAAPYGKLFIYDLEAEEGVYNEALTREVLHAQFSTTAEARWYVETAGWRDFRVFRPDADDRVWRELLGDAARTHLLAGLRPVIWKAVKC